jgi:LysR family glycine cleavage system transcriptional activator
MRAIPPLSAVRVFESAARHENFTRAGFELGMTQAAVSYQVKLLEGRLGTSLFLRHKGRLSLTETGRRIAPLVSQSFDTLDRAFRLARAEDDRVLTISTVQSFAANWLAARIGAFQIARPQLAVRLRSDDHYVDFAAEDVDVAIRNGTGSWPGVAAHFLMRVAIQPLASPGFIARNAKVESPSDVMRLPRLSPDDWWWTRWLTASGGVPDGGQTAPGIRLDSQIVEGNAAMAGHGAAILNALMWQNEIESGRLVPLGPYALASHSFWLVYPEHRRQSPKIRAFRNWLDEVVAVAARDQPAILFTPPAED